MDDSEDLPGCGWCPGPRQLTEGLGLLCSVTRAGDKTQGERSAETDEKRWKWMKMGEMPLSKMLMMEMGVEERKIGRGGRREEEKKKDVGG